MASSKLPKKNETLEIRLPDEAKAAFMERCRQQELTASEAIRAFIDDQVSLGANIGRRRVPHWRIWTAGIIGVALGMGVAAPSFARSTPATHFTFEQLDRNQDGLLSYQEFRQR